MEYLSTTTLAEMLGIPSKELFNKLKTAGFIDRKNDKWILTDQGKKIGGQMKYNPKFGEYIVWPESIFDDKKDTNNSPKLINATAIGKYFNVSNQRLNLILSELGWIEKDIAGWEITKLGKSLGGKQFEHETSGNTYVLWPENILGNKNLISVFKDSQIVEADNTSNNIESKQLQSQTTKSSGQNFREKFPATLRTKDGHWVRSRAELIIDNALYDYGLAHAYERKLPVEEELYSDFYIPSAKVFIEYWGMENDSAYIKRKNEKIEIYKKYGLKLIELTDEDISSLDDHLPKKLLKFDIKVF